MATQSGPTGFKAPVYRVINGADGVPMVPLGSVAWTAIDAILTLPGLIAFKPWFTRLGNKGFLGYQHVGDVRFLAGPVTNATLKTGAAAVLARVLAATFGDVSRGLPGVAAFFKDHRMDAYVGKLRAIAIRKNQ